MGRDFSGSCIDEESNVVSSKGIAQVSPEDSDKNSNQVANWMNTEEKKPVLEGKTVGHEPEEKIIEAEVHNLKGMKLGSPVKTAPVSATNQMMNGNSPEPYKKMVPNTHIMERKHHYLNTKSHYDEDDNWSLSSSIATSVRTTKVTVPVAPRFNCVDRLQRRKEFYSKLEEKHKALEKEKHDYEARIKEEDQAALKLLRKNMSYKANPVPSFYREGPPPKVELKKIPVTRAKSPNFTRRKSCGDAGTTKPSPLGKLAGSRHSTGATKQVPKSLSPLSSKSRTQNGSPVSNGSGKTRATRSQTKMTTEPEISSGEGTANGDIAVAS